VVNAAPPAIDVAGDNFGWVWLRRDNTDLMLNTAYDPDAERPAEPDPARVAAHHDTILYLGCPDVDGAYEELRRRGIESPG
jgi:glyoxylase I family protein